MSVKLELTIASHPGVRFKAANASSKFSKDWFAEVWPFRYSHKLDTLKSLKLSRANHVFE